MYLPRLLVLILVSIPYLVFAECESNADCPAGSVCAFEGSICIVDDMGNEVCEGGGNSFCVEAPYTPSACESNEDCPGHLTCASSYSETTSSEATSSEAPVDVECIEEDCETDPNIPCEGDDCIEMEVPVEQYQCIYQEIDCTVDTDCPDLFHCSTYEYETPCTQAPCPENEECPPVNCEPMTEVYQVCEPNEIECGDDDACPSDWSCREREIYTGGCGESEPIEAIPVEPSEEESSSEEGESEEAVDEDTGTDKLMAEEDCFEEVSVTRICVPDGLSPYDIANQNSESAAGNTDNEYRENDPVSNEVDTDDEESAESTIPNETDTDDMNMNAANTDVEEGGCSTHPHANGFLAFVMLFVIGMKRRFGRFLS